MRTTILRVKRRRDDFLPPTLTIPLQQSKSTTSTATTSTTTTTTSTTADNQKQNQNCVVVGKKAKYDRRTKREDTILADLMHKNASLNDTLHSSGSRVSTNISSSSSSSPRSHIVFKRITNDTNNLFNNNQNNNMVQVVDLISKDLLEKPNNENNPRRRKNSRTYRDSELDDYDDGHNNKQPQKRRKISLQMVNRVTMSELNFLKMEQDPAKSNPNLASSSCCSSRIIGAQPKASLHHRPQDELNNKSKQKVLERVRHGNHGNHGNTIIHPIHRKIDESLCAINTSEQIMKHIQFVAQQSQNDTFKRNNNKNQNQIQQYLLKINCSNGSGTILHFAALFNSHNGAQEICYSNRWSFDFFHLKDKDGNTALEVANMVGSTGVVDVIESCLVQNQVNEQQNNNKTLEEKRDDEFVYDIYCVQNKVDDRNKTESPREEECKETNGENNITLPNTHQSCLSGEESNDGGINKNKNSDCGDNSKDAKSQTIVTDEIIDNIDDDDNIGCYGDAIYWNEMGEIVINDSQSDDEASNDSDTDSNEEDHAFNDYPDEEIDVDCESDNSSDSDQALTQSYYNRHYQHNGNNGSLLNSSSSSGDWDDDDKRGFTRMVQPIHSGQRRVNLGNIGVESDDSGDWDDDGEYREFMHGYVSKHINKRTIEKHPRSQDNQQYSCSKNLILKR